MTAPVTISESTAGPNRDASSAESVLAIIGCAVDGDTDAPTVARNESQPAESFTAGLLVDYGAIVVGEGRQPAVLIRAATVTPGAYGELDDDGFTGTAVPGLDTSVIPHGPYEAYVFFVNDGVLGTPGISYYTSLDDGRTLSAIQALGTDSSILILGNDGRGNVKFTLELTSAQISALVALVNELRTDRLAHYPYTTGGVHLGADTTSDDGIGAAATNETTAITLVNQIRAADLLHAANLTAHTTADTVNYVGCPAAAVSSTDAVKLAVFLKAADNAHDGTTTIGSDTVHGVADAAHLTTSADATRPTILAGDVLRVATTGPTFDATSLAAALASLPTYQGQRFGGLCVAGALTTAQEWTSLINALDALEERQRSCCALVEWRVPNSGESETAYRNAWEAFRNTLSRDNRVTWVVGGGRYYPTEVRQAAQQFFRTALAPAAARHVALRYEQSHALVDPIARPLSATPATFGGPLRGYRIYDGDAIPIGHDEAANPGLAPLLAMTTTTYPQEGSAAFLTEPLTFRPEGDTVYTLPIRRIANVAKRLIYFRLTRRVQTLLLRQRGQTQMSPAAANTLNKEALAELRGELKGRVTDVTFAVDVPGSDISVTSPRVLWNATITTGGYAAGFDGKLSINQ